MIVDDREHDLIATLIDMGIKVDVQHLLVGDIIIGDICFERKEIHDLIGSLNYRMWEQLLNMKTNYDKSLVIVEGDFKKFKPSYSQRIKFFSKNMYYGFISKALTKYNVPVTVTQNIEETALLLQKIEEKMAKYSDGVIDYSKEVIRVRKGKGDVYIEMLATIPGIGIDKARLVLSDYKFKELFDLSQKELIQIKGIGNKIAENIKKWLK